ncbi:MAG: helicase HerA-like domain-containing protein [Pseudomonadota bacterium]
MADTLSVLIGGTNGARISLDASMANRHGIISGATGTGKTVTLQILAEGFSRIGVPVFMADAKGDLSGIAAPGNPNPKITKRVQQIGLDDYRPHPFPTLFWDVFGNSGHPIRTTLSDMGPLLLGNLLELNDAQSGVLYSCFKLADDQGMLLLDLKDLRAMLQWMSDNASALKTDYGNIFPSSVGAIQRCLLVLEEQGADRFFGEPALNLNDLMHTDFSGNGVVSLLDASDLLSKSPRLYATLLLWLLSEIFENLPEVGDASRPRLVLFFDEAHLLFDGTPKALVDKIKQVVRLIRSKGVGIFFITQSPLDVPEEILGQLGLRIQHALRAFTPKDRRTVKTVAETFRQNPAIDTLETVTSMGIGEALVSFLDRTGAPTPVERVLIRPPESKIGPIDTEKKGEALQRSPVKGKYDESVDRESAYELLKQRAERAATVESEIRTRGAGRKTQRAPRRGRESAGEAFLKSAARAVGSQIGRQLIRGIMGSLLGSRR